MVKKKPDPLGIRKTAKRFTLSTNKMRGKFAEDSFALEQRMRGNEVKRIHKGGDYVVQKKGLFGRKVGKPVTHEVKTGKSKLSPAQEKKKKQLKGRYKVDRY